MMRLRWRLASRRVPTAAPRGAGRGWRHGARVVAVVSAALLAVPVVSGSAAYFTDAKSVSASASTATLLPVSAAAVKGQGAGNTVSWSPAATQAGALDPDAVSYSVQRQPAGRPAQTIGTTPGATTSFTDPHPVVRPFGMVSAGGGFTVGVTSEGSVQAWGFGNGGRLGDGGPLVSDDSKDSLVPVSVVSSWGAGVRIVQVSAGASHTLALDSTGKVWAWGTAWLGDEKHSEASSTPVAVAFPGEGSGAVTITQVSAGSGTSLAVDSRGGVWSWGNNRWTLGYSDAGDWRTPHRLSSFDENGVKIAQVSLGANHALAVTSEGKVWAWGNNSLGAVGDTSITSSNLPRRVGATALSGHMITQVSAGDGSSLAVDSEGQVFAWGNSTSGQLGYGGLGILYEPTSITLSTTETVSIAQVSAGSRHSLAVDTAGNVWSWGTGTQGALGRGREEFDALTPQRLDGVQKVTQVSASTNHSVAVTTDGAVWTWGASWNGELGNGQRDNQYSPVPVNRVFTQVSAGNDHSLGLASDGSVWAWGSGKWGQLGDGGRADSAVPVRVTPSWGDNVKIIQVSAGGIHSLALDENGSIWSWGNRATGGMVNNDWGSAYVPVTVSDSWRLAHPNVRFEQISAGGYNPDAGSANLAVDSTGSVWSWGYSDYMDFSRNVPTQVSNVPGEVSPLDGQRVEQVSAGNNFMLALTSSGTVYSWGRVNHGQVGNVDPLKKEKEELSGRPEPAAISTYGDLATPPKIEQVSANGLHAMALDFTGTVWEWGSLDEVSSVGDRPVKVTVPMSAGKTVKSVSAGGRHSLARDSDGQVWAWGYNDVGQLGVGSSVGFTGTPTAAPGLAGVTHIAAGYAHSLATTTGWSVNAWGRGTSGELGNGLRENQPTPVSVTRQPTIFANCATPAVLTAGYCTGDVTYSVLYDYLGWTSPPATAQLSR